MKQLGRYVLNKNYYIIQQEVEREVIRAIRKKEFQLYLQPKVDTQREQLAGAEVLIRWKRHFKEMVKPDEFIPILEEYGAITKLDEYVFHEMCKLQKKWIKQGIFLPLSINESRRHLRNENHIEQLLQEVTNYSIPTHLIELEMAESAVVEDILQAKRAQQKAHQLGFIVAMDDFGVGYSSFSMLKNIPIDILKIDKTFFGQITQNERGKVIIESIVQMAKKLNSKTVAEGIETKEQVEYLKKIGCDYIQGYYYSAPIKIEEFEQKWLNNKD